MNVMPVKDTPTIYHNKVEESLLTEYISMGRQRAALLAMEGLNL
jgi:hypothetical protein